MHVRHTWWIAVLTFAFAFSGAGAAHADRWEKAWNKATRAGTQAKYDGRFAPAEKQFQAALRLVDTEAHAADPRLVESLDNLAALYMKRGRFAQAQPLYLRALHLRESAGGAEHPDVATGLMNLGWLRDAQGRYRDAEQYYTRALAIREKGLGPDHPDVATTLTALADLYAMQDKFDAAMTAYGRAGNIVAHALGATHLRVCDAVGRMAWVRALQGREAEADTLFEKAIALYHRTQADPADVVVSLHVLAGVYQERELFPQAERLYKWAVKTMEANLGPDHENLATSLNNLAGMYYAQGRYDEAEPLYQRTLTIAERTLGPDHPGTATAMHNLAGLYQAQGRYPEAAHLYSRALEIREAAFGRDDLQVADSLDTLAALDTARGRFGEAGPLYERALRIREAQLGPEHLDVATSLNNLATLHHTMGELDRAKPLYARATAITEQQLGPDDIGVATGLNNLAAVAFLKNDYAVAEKRYRRSLDIRERALGADHPAVATGLNNLAALYEAQGRYAEAEPLYERALRIQEARLGDEHPTVGLTLNNLARLYHSRTDYAKAEPLFQRAARIIGASLGRRHPAYARVQHNLGVLYGNWGKPEQALREQLHGLDAVAAILEDLSLWAPENRLYAYLLTLEYRYDQFYSLLAQSPDVTAPLAARALRAHLAYKGLAAETVARRSRLALLADDPELSGYIEQLRGVTQRLSAVSLEGPGEGSPADHAKLIAQLEKRQEQLEEQLARRVTAVAVYREAGRVTVESVVAALPPGGMYLDFVAYDNYDYEHARWSDTRRYLAFTLTRGADGTPAVRIVDLGPANEIDALIAQWREALQLEAQQTRGIGGVRRAQRAPDRPTADALGRRLSTRVLAPFADTLEPARVLCVAPGGNLNLVPFEILSASSGAAYLGDRVQVAYVLGRDLQAARALEEPQNTARGFYLFAAPDFAPQQSRRRRATAARAQPAVLTRGLVRGWPLTLEPLPGTRAEADSIRKAAGRRRVTAYLGRKATEGRFKSLDHPAQVHVATHGWFLQDVERPKPRGVRGIGGVRPGPAGTFDTDTLVGTIELRNPLLRSGLAFAGFNALAQGGDAPAEQEDGILTALEVTALDLGGTDLVVLSACDTGLGEIQRGQGVAGLRRAFRIAGAENVLMSLWSVPDEETAWLMEEFHRRYLAGESPLDALQGARKTVRARLIERDGTDHPYFWAAFVLQSAALG